MELETLLDIAVNLNADQEQRASDDQYQTEIPSDGCSKVNRH